MIGIKTKENKPATEQKNWYADRYQHVVVQRNILAVITVISLLCALAAAFSISQLAPLKSIEPFVIQVDQKSGITQVVNPLTAHELTATEAVNNYFLVLYVRSRESYGINDAQNYNVVRVMSDPAVFTTYAYQISPNNPNSTKNMLSGLGGIRRVRFGNLTLIDKSLDKDGTDKLRYQLHIVLEDVVAGQITNTYNRLVTIEFKYVELELSTQDRYLNPLGFRVVGYRLDEDTLTR